MSNNYTNEKTKVKCPKCHGYFVDPGQVCLNCGGTPVKKVEAKKELPVNNTQE